MSNTSILLNAKKETGGARSFTISGTAGMGKSTLACLMPGKSFYIRASGESLPDDIPDDRQPDCLGETDTYNKLMQQLTALLNDEHDYNNVIIDAATTFDAMFIEEILKKEGVTNLNKAGGGYGGGYDILASMHANVRKITQRLQTKRNMNVVFVAHSDIKDISPPDGETYSYYSLRMHKKSIPFYVDKVDFVGFIRIKPLLVKENENSSRKKLIDNDERELVCVSSTIAVTKNRIGIGYNLTFTKGENPLLPHIDPTLKKVEPKQAQPVQELDDNENDGF